MNPHLCTLCGEPAAVRVWLPRGCAAIDDRNQSLCVQHAMSCEPVEQGRLLDVYHAAAAQLTGWVP